ncbi:unnamed protein product [Trifolium pratense]|uniref:Uncharacterized protein n=1 Tax=Trifolium pratense TaxID=57577 RepID=A0ACB0JEN8_TRIPR|nr:unnamed protein product [Trifolium pratense]
MPDVNILQIGGGMHKLEILYLANNSNIVGVEPNHHRFPCLESLSLSYVCNISALDLNLLVSACPKIEALELVNPEIAISDSLATIERTHDDTEKDSSSDSEYVASTPLDTEHNVG